MPKRTNRFQQLITTIHSCMNANGVVEESALLKDKVSHEEREVDILLTHQVGGYSVLIGIEVVSWKRKADVPWVEKMVKKHESLPTNKLVLVSESGFSKNAIIKSAFYDVEVICIEDALNVNWTDSITMIGSGVFMLVDVKWNCTAHIEGSKDFIPLPVNITVFNPDGSSFLVGEIVHFLLYSKLVRSTFLDHYEKTKETNYYAKHAFFSPVDYSMERNRLSGLKTIYVGIKLDVRSTPLVFSTGSFFGHDIAYGMPEDNKGRLCVVWAKDRHENVKAMLYDQGELKELQFDGAPFSESDF